MQVALSSSSAEEEGEPSLTIGALSNRANECYQSDDIAQACLYLDDIKNKLGPKKVDISISQNLIVLHHSLGNMRTNSEEFLDLLRGSIENDSGRDTLSWKAILAGVTPKLATLYFNLAAIYAQELNYEQSMQLLEALVPYFEVLDESLVFSISFLYLEVFMRIVQSQGSSSIDSYEIVSEKINDIITFIDRLNGNEINNRPVLQALENLPDDVVISSKQRPLFIRSWVSFKIHLYQCRCLMEMNQLKQSKKAIKNALEIYQKEFRQYADSTSTSIPSAVSYLSRAYFGCPVSSVDRQNQLALFVKANLEYFRKNFKKALKLLTSCRRRDRDSTENNSTFFNNVGCIYFKLERFNAALVFFQKASDFVIQPSCSQYLLHSCPPEVTYNQGLSLLAADMPTEAFKSFSLSESHFSKRPQYWARMAECCIRRHIMTKEMRALNAYSLQSVFSGSKRVVVLQSLHETSSYIHRDEEIDGAMNLSHAKSFVFKGLQILAANKTTLVTSYSAEEVARKGALIGSADRDKDEIDGGVVEEITYLRAEALMEGLMLLMAYIHLELSEYDEALMVTSDVLCKEDISARTRLLAESYHTEALCLLGRQEDAATFYESEFTCQGSLALSHRYPVTLGRPQITDVEEFEALVSLNRGVQYAMSGKLLEAQKLVLKALQLIPDCSVALNTLVYILLKTGQHTLALGVLRGSRTHLS